MKNIIKDMKQRTNKRKTYSFEEFCPCPYDPSILVAPYLRGFEIPKFTKYEGKGDPHDHVREFHILCQEVSYSHLYLPRLFPKSLMGDALAWFSSLPRGSIVSFPNLVEKFVAHYAYNMVNDVSMMDLCNTKQRPRETFANFLQRW